MKKAMKTQIIRWHMAGLSVHEIVKIVPQYCGLEIKAVIDEYEKKVEWERMMSGLRSC